MKYIIIAFILFSSYSCKRENKNYKKTSHYSTFTKLVINNNTIPNKLIRKYSNKLFFTRILEFDSKLKKDIIRTNGNHTEIEYKETHLEKKMILCQFIMREEVEYDYIFRNKKLIYKVITPINRAHFSYTYKDWNNDKKPELITYYEEWEGGSNLGYHKSKSVYEVKNDTILNIINLPLESIYCQDGITSYIETYEYHFNKKNNYLTIKKTFAKGSCDKNEIKKIDSSNSKSYLLQRFNNIIKI